MLIFTIKVNKIKEEQESSYLYFFVIFVPNWLIFLLKCDHIKRLLLYLLTLITNFYSKYHNFKIVRTMFFLLAQQ